MFVRMSIFNVSPNFSLKFLVRASMLLSQAVTLDSTSSMFLMKDGDVTAATILMARAMVRSAYFAWSSRQATNPNMSWHARTIDNASPLTLVQSKS